MSRCPECHGKAANCDCCQSCIELRSDIDDIEFEAVTRENELRAEIARLREAIDKSFALVGGIDSCEWEEVTFEACRILAKALNPEN